MTRRRIVALTSAGVIFGIALIATILLVSLTQTAYGRDRVRDFLLSRVTSAMSDRGTMYIGRMEGGLFTGVTIDSVAILDAEDSVFVAVGRVRIAYDPRDLLDRRVLIRRVELDRPVINLRRHANGEWNYDRIFPRGDGRTPGARERGFGDYILIRDAVLRDGTFLVTEPWSPPDSLQDARRDSAVTFALTRHDADVRETGEGLKRTLRFTGIELRSPHVRIAHPDSAGQYLVISRLDVDVADPPFSFRNIQGGVRIGRDTVRFEARHFELPGSSGSGQGMVTYGGGRGTRYDIRIRGDRVDLADINWVYPALPRTGGGSMSLHIRSGTKRGVIEYAITDLDVRTTGSHLRGAMTFGVGEPVLVVKDVDLRADPVSFDFIRELNGGPFPVDWRGNIHATVSAPGGPLNRWRLGEARFTFEDGHIGGATSRGIARGELNILDPAETIFRGLDVEIATLDLRTVEHLFEDFPRLGGTISGRARLDSLWQDVRFSSADITHRNGEGTPSRMLGAGRVDIRGDEMLFDIDMQADALSFTMLRRSYPGLALAGSFSGPVRARGRMSDLQLSTTLTGAAGGFAVDGTFDLLEPQLRATGRLSTHALDLRRLLDRPDLPATSLHASVEGDLRGSDSDDLAGTLVLAVEPSQLNGLRIDQSRGQLQFGDGRMRLESLEIQTSLARLSAQGVIGLVTPVTDSLRYRLEIDSLAVLAHLLPRSSQMRARIEAAAEDESLLAAPEDSAEDLSLGGSLIVIGSLTGSLDSLSTRGTLDGLRLALGANSAQRLHGEFDLTSITADPRGRVRASLDVLSIGGTALETMDAELRLHSADSGAVRVAARGPDGAVRWDGLFDYVRSADSVRVVAAALEMLSEGDRWTLTSPVTVLVSDEGLVIDSLLMRNGSGGVIRAFGAIPRLGQISGRLDVSRFPLSTISSIAQDLSLGGLLDLRLDLAGTRAQPQMTISGAVDQGRYGEVRFPYVSASGRYEDQRLRTNVLFIREGQTVLTFQGVLPVLISLDGASSRLLDEPLSGRIHADNVDLGIVEPMTPFFRRVTGVMHTDVTLGGTWSLPTFTGRFSIANGEAGVPELGIRLRRITAAVDFTRDSVIVHRLSAMSGEQRGDTVALRGVVRLDAGSMSGFDLTLTARNFRAARSRRLADLDVSSDGVRLHGSLYSSALDGALRITRGVIYIPDRLQKHVVELDELNDDLRQLVDTSVAANRHLLPRRRSETVNDIVRGLSVEDFRVMIGDDFWLRSSEANVKLTGEVDILRSGEELALRGALNANRGTYRLDLGLVQRTFQVDSGSINFYGEPELNPTLDIWASHLVRQANRQGQDVRIHANIGGTLQELRLSLTSDEQLALSYTEMLSYLVFGAPSFAVGIESSGALRPVASALFPTLGGYAERFLSEQIGFFDIFQIHAGSVGAAGDEFSLSTGTRSVLEGSRIAVGKQLDDRTFLTANAGLCALTNRGDHNFTESLGLTLERRLEHGFTAQVAMEPGSVALLCRPGRFELNTPRQFGFDLFREWSF
jgi:translocation and assembly module TamB